MNKNTLGLIGWTPAGVYSNQSSAQKRKVGAADSKDFNMACLNLRRSMAVAAGLAASDRASDRTTAALIPT